MTTLQLKSRHDGFALPAYRLPAEGRRCGGVVVIQEIFGVTEHIRAMCAAFAAQGYDAIAPALFARIDPEFHAGHDPDGVARGREAVIASSFDQVVGDVQAAIEALSGPAFVTGFCYGGAVAWLAAARCTGLAAASGFYGRLIATQMLELAPRVPTLLHYGKTDASIPPEDIEAVRRAHPGVAIHLYDAGHGFCRAGSPDYDPPACRLALDRTLTHFTNAASSLNA
jgi:carboxymethylenebutenolidase